MTLIQSISASEAAHQLASARGQSITSLISEEVLLTIIFWIVGVLVAMTITFIVASLIKRQNANLTNSKKVVLEDRYRQFLAELISGDFTDETTALVYDSEEQTLALSLKDITGTLERKVLIKELMQLHKAITGPEQAQLRKVYLMMAYKDEDMKSLKSSNPYELITAVQRMEQMEVRDSYTKIFELINHKDSRIRDAIISARTHLEGSPLRFLREINFPLTDWQHSIVLSNLQRYHQHNPPKSAPFFEHPEITVKLLTIRIADHFQQDDTVRQIVTLAHHSDNRINEAATKALARFPSKEVKLELQKLVAQTGERQRLIALQSLRSMLFENDSSWLEDLLSDPQRRIVIEAASALLDLDKTERIREFQSTADESLRAIIDQALEPALK